VSYREHKRAATICAGECGTLDTERAWNLADAACQLRRWEETAAILGNHLPRNPHLTKLLDTNARQHEWPAFLSLYHEDAGRFVPAHPEAYRSTES
jgi:hypothetical protein